MNCSISDNLCLIYTKSGEWARAHFKAKEQGSLISAWLEL